jgi:chitodextrinase
LRLLRRFPVLRAPSVVSISALTVILILQGCSASSYSSSDPPIAVVVSPTSASVTVAKTQPFAASVSGTTNTAVTWQVNGVAGGDAAHGAISAAGMYTAPATVPSAPMVTVAAVSQADATKSASATVTVIAASSDTTAPSAPTSLAGTAVSSAQINLTWTASTDNVGVTGYRIERCSGSGCTSFAQIGTTTGVTTFASSGLTPATAYRYRVLATDAAGNLSSYSNIASATTGSTSDTTPPSAPSNLVVAASSSTQIGLTWTASSDNVGVTGYRIERCSGASCSSFAQVGTTTGAATFADSGLTASTSYSYRVRASDAAGNLGSYSNVASATTSASGGTSITVSVSPSRGGLVTSQTLSIKATLTNDTGNQGVNWTATGGSFSPTSSTSGNSVTFTAPSSAGVVTISATSVADNAKIATATIGVTDLAGVLTYHNNPSRDGTNQREFALTPSNLTTSTFGKLFSCTADAALYAQPLWIPKVSIGSGIHNVILAASMRDTVYAFDADKSPCTTYWSKTLIPSGEAYGTSTDVGSGDIYPDIGILGTPVIDSSSNTVYLVSKTKDGSGVYHQRLHALSLTDGSEKFGGPVDLTDSITVAGTGDTGDSSTSCSSSSGLVPFCPLRENQRPGLALNNGVVYLTWGSHGDQGPYHGWVMGFNSSTLARVSTFNSSPNGRQGGIWMGGGAPAIDSGGNLFVITGNGDFDGSTDFGDSVLKLSSSLGISGSFTSAVQATLDANDLDLGSGGAVVLIDLPSSSIPHILVGGGKGNGFVGTMYVMNRDSLGGYQQGASQTDNVVQSFDIGKGIFSTPGFWQNTLYVSGFGTTMKAYALNSSTSHFNSTPTSQSPTTFTAFGATPSISSNGGNDGIVWAIDFSSYGTGNFGAASAGPAILHAYDANNLATELWNSSQGTGNTAGNAVKFTVPTVANGKVYIGTRGNDTTTNSPTARGELDVYGLLP